MIQHRCPWCGERIPFHLPVVQLLWKFAHPDICPKCKKLYTSNTSRNSVIILAVGLAGIYIYKYVIKRFQNDTMVYWLLGIAGLMLLAIVFVELCRIPYARDIKKKEKPCIIPKRTANVTLSWEKHKNKGLLLPRLQVLNGEIFPACFMDADGTPISTAFCVVLEHFFWSDNYHCTCKINFVLDDAPEENLFQVGNQFCLYYNYRNIAKGIVF